jgi:hypothetical protein
LRQNDIVRFSVSPSRGLGSASLFTGRSLIVLPESFRGVYILHKIITASAINGSTVPFRAGHNALVRDKMDKIMKIRLFAGTCILLLLFTAVMSVWVKEDNASDVAPASIKFHPKVFRLIDCWMSDSEGPVVTEINLDAIDGNGNQFYEANVTQNDKWTEYRGDEGDGYYGHRVSKKKGNHYVAECYENGGGTLTTFCTIGFSLEKREIQRDGERAVIRVLRVTSYNQGSPNSKQN